MKSGHASACRRGTGTHHPLALSYQTQRTGDPNAVRTGERETGSSAQGRHEARGDVRMSALAALRVAELLSGL